MMLEDLFEELGYKFRQLTLHSDGRWTAHVGREYANVNGFTKFMVSGETAQEALEKLLGKIDNMECRDE